MYMRHLRSGIFVADGASPPAYSYILNRGWIDKTARRLPTYKEITGNEKVKAGSESEDDESDDEAEGDGAEGLMDEDEFDDMADAFESSYNFRFEEPYVAFHFLISPQVSYSGSSTGMLQRSRGIPVPSPLSSAGKIPLARTRARSAKRARRRSCSRSGRRSNGSKR